MVNCLWWILFGSFLLRELLRCCLMEGSGTKKWRAGPGGRVGPGGLLDSGCLMWWGGPLCFVPRLLLFQKIWVKTHVSPGRQLGAIYESCPSFSASRGAPPLTGSLGLSRPRGVFWLATACRLIRALIDHKVLVPRTTPIWLESLSHTAHTEERSAFSPTIKNESITTSPQLPSHLYFLHDHATQHSR